MALVKPLVAFYLIFWPAHAPSITYFKVIYIGFGGPGRTMDLFSAVSMALPLSIGRLAAAQPYMPLLMQEWRNNSK